MDVRDKHPSVASGMGSNPHPRHVPLTGIKPTGFFGAQDDAPTNQANWPGLKIF